LLIQVYNTPMQSDHRYKELREIRAKLLIAYVMDTKKHFTDLLKEDKPYLNEVLTYTSVISEKELGSALNHELEHKKIWDKYGIKNEFRKDLWEGKFTLDVDFDEKAKSMNREQTLNIMKEVCYAPYAAGYPYEECIGDLYQYEILSGQQVTASITNIDRIRMRAKYAKPKLEEVNK